MCSELASAIAASDHNPIHEVLLRGSSRVSEHYFRARAAAYLRQSLGCSEISLARRGAGPELLLELQHWQHPSADLLNFDRLISSMQRSGPFTLVLWTRDWLFGTHSALEVLNRYQCWLPLPVGMEHALLPRAGGVEFDRSLWRLRLERSDHPAASLARDAGDISFFSMQSWQFLKLHGRAKTLRVVEARLSRMSELARCHALGTRQPPDIADALERFFARRRFSALETAPQRPASLLARPVRV